MDINHLFTWGDYNSIGPNIKTRFKALDPTSWEILMRLAFGVAQVKLVIKALSYIWFHIEIMAYEGYLKVRRNSFIKSKTFLIIGNLAEFSGEIGK